MSAVDVRISVDQLVQILNGRAEAAMRRGMPNQAAGLREAISVAQMQARAVAGNAAAACDTGSGCVIASTDDSPAVRGPENGS